jgi:ParB-like chromosome segregation protein Spo0J
VEQQAKSFKQMIKDGDIKRADATKIRIQDIHEEAGFNLRREGEDLEASINALADYIATGGILPPLEVRPRPEGGVYLVDGHRRRRAFLRCLERGAAIGDANGEVWVSVVQFQGNDAERTLRVITSAEGRNLSPLEVAEGYRRLARFGWSSEEIAAKVHKTRQHVDQLLILANANADVQGMVAGGQVSATTAIDTLRKHGEKAGDVLAGAVDKAKAAGKTKATAGAVKGKPIPRKLVDELEPILYRIADAPTTDAELMAELRDIVADIRAARAKQASKAQSDDVKARQTDIEDADARPSVDDAVAAFTGL